MVLCVDLAKTYAGERGDVAAVNGITIEVQGGEFASIVGRSGSGKSSLLAMIGGLSGRRAAPCTSRTPTSGP
jgi:ABC-type lipoprotein export system ATPase subunit